MAISPTSSNRSQLANTRYLEHEVSVRQHTLSGGNWPSTLQKMDVFYEELCDKPEKAKERRVLLEKPHIVGHLLRIKHVNMRTVTMN